MKNVTITDVSREAGVSMSTVSNVLNNKPRVSENTRKKVLAAIKRLNFTPSSAARNLSRRKTGTIGVILPVFAGFFGRLFYGIQEIIAPRGLYILAVALHDMGKIYETTMKLLQERRVDGLILYNQDFSPKQVKELYEYPIPVVAPDQLVKGPRLNAVRYDNYQAGYEATKHLIEHGHKRIATLTGPLKWVSASDRLRGYKAALKDFGLPFDARLVVEGTWLEEPSTDRFISHFRDLKWPEAIVAGNDYMALGLLRYISNHQDRLVRATAVVGFDDIEAAGVAGLTTLYASNEELGRRLAGLLLELIDENGNRGTEPREKILPVHLVKRSSCGCVFSAVKPR